jgi:radical SAM superfamily enzyme YgiQ (UPF0313 family)
LTTSTALTYKPAMDASPGTNSPGAAKIALIYPYFLNPRLHTEEIAAIPLGLHYLGARLQADGYAVTLLNWHAMDQDPRVLRGTLSDLKPTIIGFSIVHANRWGAIDIAAVAKELDPGIKIVCGGIGATFLWRHLLTHFSAIDYVIRGEGEIALPALVRAIEANRKDLADIPNLAWRGPDGIVANPMAPLVADLDQLPPPARHFDFQHLAVTRGCPGRCAFCGSPRFWGRGVRSHSTAYMIDQITLLAARGTNFFFLSDDTFTLKPRRVIELCQGLVERNLNISWQAISKVNAVDEEVLRWMRKAGCVQISYGIESGDETIRRKLRKDIDEAQIARAFDLTVRYGILARAYFIYGAPGESDATIDATLALIEKIRPLAAIFYIMTLFPGTTMYDDYLRRAGVDDDIWLQRIEDLLYFETDPDLDREQVFSFGRRLRSAYHAALPRFAQDILLAEEPALYPEQADFLSRLGMTFSHGDYARQVQPDQGRTTARQLFERALTLAPDPRAFWGLALLDQEAGAWERAEKNLSRGLDHHPHNLLLNLRMAVGFMHRGEYRKASEYLRQFSDSPEAQRLLHHCRRFF